MQVLGNFILTFDTQKDIMYLNMYRSIYTYAHLQKILLYVLYLASKAQKGARENGKNYQKDNR